MENTQTTTQPPSVTPPQTRLIAEEARQRDVHYLNPADIQILAGIADEAAKARGADFYAWKNAPEHKNGEFSHTTGWGPAATTQSLSAEQALDLYKQKLDGAYGERFLMTIAAIAGFVEKGHKVALLQLQEEGTPFDARGWVVVSVNGYPMFHISPDDLPMEKVAEAGLVRVIAKNSEAAQEHAWKGTDKLQEFGLLLKWATAPAPS